MAKAKKKKNVEETSRAAFESQPAPSGFRLTPNAAEELQKMDGLLPGATQTEWLHELEQGWDELQASGTHG